MSETPVPLLLRQQRYQESSARFSRDFQERVGHPRTDSEEPLSCVVVLTRAADREVDELSLRLAADGIPLLRIDSDRCPGQLTCWDVTTGVLTFGQHSYEPAVVWLRYFTGPSIPRYAAETVHGTRSREHDELLSAYVQNQWSAWRAMLQGLPNVAVINATDRSDGYLDRISQITAAQDVGLRVPLTVVTSCPAEGVYRIPGTDDVFIKSLGDHYLEPFPSMLNGLFPWRISRRTLAACQGLEPAPVVLQEFIRAVRELRVYAIAGQLYCFAVEKETAEAVFTDSARVIVTRTELPAELDSPLRTLLRQWRLDIAAFDLLETTSGPVFLEVNTVCDWLWCERNARTTPVTDAVQEMIAERYNGTSASRGSTVTRRCVQ